MCLALALLVLLAVPVSAAEPPTLEVFTRAGCPRCAVARRCLEELRRAHPWLVVRELDVDADPVARSRLAQLGREHAVAVLGVPAFHLRGRLIVGYASDDTTGAQLRTLVAAAEPSIASGASGDACPMAGSPCPRADTPQADIIDAPLVGRLSASRLGLPLFTVLVGLVDGFNPCAMWVLLFLLSMLLHLRDRRRMLLLGGTFVLTSGVVYFAFMAAWLNLMLLIGLSRAVQVALGVVALAAGGINVKDFFAFKKGISLSIPESAKPGIYARVRRLVNAPKLGAAVFGAVVLALLVNFVELLCTAGLPALYTQILTLRRLPGWAYYGYLALYNAAYVLDDSLMLGIAVITLGRHKLTERGGRVLKLVSGSVMLALGLVLLFRPAWLVF